jgi:hypothetical protein
LNQEIQTEIKSELGQNKILEFETPEGIITLNFDLLDYGEFVQNDAIVEVDAENLDIELEKNSEKYKWGYNVKLNNLNFLARIDVDSEESILIVDNQTLKIGNN